MKYGLGKRPARPDAVKFRFTKYFDLAQLPKPPLRIGHELIGHDWGMLANDTVGCCVVASAGHETMTFSHMGTRGPGVAFTDAGVISDYSAGLVHGGSPAYDGTEATDAGLDLSDFCKYRRTTGVIDANGNRHKIDAYLALEPGNPEHLAVALLLTGAVGIGIRCPSNLDKLFDAGRVWDVKSRSKIVGGHAIPVVLRNTKNNWGVVTWGGLQGMTNKFYDKYCDEAVAYISTEMITQKGLTPDGFDLATLQKDIALLNATGGNQ